MATITVIGVEPNRVDLWEKNALHFGGQAYVCVGMVAQVSDTSEALGRISNGILALSVATPTKPWTGYDALSEGDVITQIATLGDVEKIVTKQYEAANSNRSAVIAALP